MAFLAKDARIPPNAPDELLLDLHKEFILKYDRNKEDYDFVMSEFLR